MTGPDDRPEGPAAGDGTEEEAADSAGQPWTGRSLPTTGFEGDLGAPDADVVAALADGADDGVLMRALERARLLVPVVAQPAELVGTGPERSEKRTEMALVTLVAGDGVRALPVFTGLRLLGAWNGSARPVPVTAARGARAGMAEGCDVLVVDVGSPHERELRPSMVRALAEGRSWRAAHEDPVVASAVGRVVSGNRRVTGHALRDGDPAGRGVLGVVLELRRGLSREEASAVAGDVGRELAADDAVRSRVDGLSLHLT